jgi:hypothetical protein
MGRYSNRKTWINSLENSFRSGIGNACKWRKKLGSETFGQFNTKNVGQKLALPYEHFELYPEKELH